MRRDTIESRERESQKKLFFKVVFGPSLEPNLPKSKADEQSHVPCNQPQPGHKNKFKKKKPKSMKHQKN